MILKKKYLIIFHKFHPNYMLYVYKLTHNEFQKTNKIENFRKFRNKFRLEINVTNK